MTIKYLKFYIKLPVFQIKNLNASIDNCINYYKSEIKLFPKIITQLFMIIKGINQYNQSFIKPNRPNRLAKHLLTLIRSPGIDYPAAIYVIRVNAGCW